MVNLLPLEEKQRIKKMYRERLLVVTLIFTLFIAGLSTLTLLPAVFWSFVKDKAAHERLVIVSQVISAEERKNIRKAVAGINQKIALLAQTKYRAIPVHSIIETINSRRTGGIALIAFFTEQDLIDGGGRTATISGISKNRSTLLFFVNELRREDIFAEVNLPVSNFTKSRDIPFSISLLLNSNAPTQ